MSEVLAEEIKYTEAVLENKVNEEEREVQKALIDETRKEAEFDLDKALDTYDPTFPGYTPSKHAMEMINMMTLVKGCDQEFPSPIAHYFMADLLLGEIKDTSVFPYSKEVTDSVELNSLRLAFMCSRGVAKALPLDYPIMSEYPGKTIGNSKVGDTIFDGNGKLCKITNKSEIFNKPMYRITLLDGRELDMSEDHINIVWKRHSKQIGTDKSKPVINKRGEKRFKSLKITGLKEMNITAKEMYKSGVTWNRIVSNKQPKGVEYKYWIPNVGLNAEYPETHFEIDPYTVGVILGDGSTEQKNGFTRITCHDDDYEWYQKNLPYELGTYTRKYNPDSTPTNCGMFSLLGLGKLIKKFIGIDRSYTKKVPDPLLYGSRHQRLEVLRGLMDTDGSAYERSGYCAFDSTSIQLANDVQWLVRSLGGSAQIKKNKTPSPFGVSYRVKISINENIFKLPRKSERIQYRNDKYCVAITKIEKIESKPTQCITVDSPHQSFITKDWTVTHNSTLVISFFGVYSAIKGELPNGIGKVWFYLVLAASSRGGARINAQAVKAMCEDSVFLNGHFESMRFTESESEFVRKGNGPAKDRSFLIRYQGIGTGVRGIRYGERRICCHEKGTIVTTEYGTYPVENHPGISAEPKIDDGYRVKLRGLVDYENVNGDHKYWAKICTGSKCVIKKGFTGGRYKNKIPRYTELEPEFVNVKELSNRHWIGSYIDMAVEAVQPIPHTVRVDGPTYADRYERQEIVAEYMLDSEFWWVYGLWLGDGSISTRDTSMRANNKGTIVWYIADTQRHTIGQKLTSILDKIGFSHSESKSKSQNGCYTIATSKTSLADWLRTQKGSRNSEKNIPEWVLKLDLECQKQILLGYIAADGYIENKHSHIRINSVNLNVLKQLQVICSRLRLPTYIQNTKKAGVEVFPNGQECKVQHQWEIKIKQNAKAVLGDYLKLDKFVESTRVKFKQVHIADGMLWRQVKSVEDTGKIVVYPIQCDNKRLEGVVGDKHVYETIFGVSHNCVIFDDIILNEAAAYSKTITENLTSALSSDAQAALKGGGKGRLINCFTPFHYTDVNTKLILEGSYTPCVIPLARDFNVDDKGLKATMIDSSWEAMHPRKTIMQMVKDARKGKKIGAFLQERMLRLTASGDRLIPDDCIQFMDMKLIKDNISHYNIYITTDYTTTSGEDSDFSGVATWAISNNDDWFLLDITLRKRTIPEQYAATLDSADTFRAMGRFPYLGVEVDGNQAAHIHGLDTEMAKRGTFHPYARSKYDPTGKRKGILSKGSGIRKFERFRLVSTRFMQRKIWFPEHLQDTADMVEMVSQIKGATHKNFTRADDGPDLLSMLDSIDRVIPIGGVVADKKQGNGFADGFWDDDGWDEPDQNGGYLRS